MKTLTSTQQKPKYYGVLNGEGILQGVVIADNKLEERFICSIKDSYDSESVSINEGFEVGQFDYEFSVSVLIKLDDEELYSESFYFQMVEMY